MKVSDVMQKAVITVSPETLVSEVLRIIFSVGIAGIPVVKGKKVVGIITEQDVLSKLFPSIKDLTEDFFHASDFDLMEQNLINFLGAPVGEIMNKKVTTISPDTPLMQAQSLMLVNQFSRLPIVDKNRNLLGMISQGDIFRRLLKNEMPKLEKERYAGFVARHYDLMVNWKKRFGYELPVLFKLFKKEKIKTILDLGCWTGEYAVGVAKKGAKVLGLDHNPIMIRMSEEKREKLPQEVKNNLKFLLTDFTSLADQISEKFDAAICMGNSLPHIPVPLKKLFAGVSSVLREKNAVVILQLLNFEKILNNKNRLLSFIIQKSNLAYEQEHLFIEFYDRGKGNLLLHHVIVFDSDGKNWVFKGITTIPIYYLTKKEIGKTLKKFGFKEISFSGNMGEYQGEYGPLSFTEPFNPLESDWLVVLAKR